MCEAPIETETWITTIAASETKKLGYETYNYDCEVTYSTGSGLDHYTYTYTVTGDATIAVTIGGSSGGTKFYIKETTGWVQYSKLYKKTSSGWTEVDPYDELDTSKKYHFS